MKNKKLNPEDQEMLDAFESDEFKSGLQDGNVHRYTSKAVTRTFNRSSSPGSLSRPPSYSGYERLIGENGTVTTRRTRTQLAKLAEETIKKIDKRINIRISRHDLEALQRRAMEEGLPYQSLVSSVLHKYVSVGFKDIAANKALPADKVNMVKTHPYKNHSNYPCNYLTLMAIMLMIAV